MTLRRVLSLALMIVLLAACGRVAAGDGDAAPAGHDGEWVLSSGTSPAGAIPVPGQVTLTINGDEISGTSACNGYQGELQIDGNGFSVRGLGGTAMGCFGKRVVAEERYTAAIQVADRIERDGERLRITGPDVDLVFDRVPPVEPAAFEDTRWRLDSLHWGTGPDGTVSSTQAAAKLVFKADGSLVATTGCLAVSGRWRREADVVTVTGLPSVDADCQFAGDQNDHLMKILRAPFTVEVQERQLTIQQVDGDLGAGYRAD